MVTDDDRLVKAPGSKADREEMNWRDVWEAKSRGLGDYWVA